MKEGVEPLSYVTDSYTDDYAINRADEAIFRQKCME